MLPLSLCLLILVFGFCLFTRFVDGAMIRPDRTLEHLRPEGNLEKFGSEIWICAGIVFGGVYGTLTKDKSCEQNCWFYDFANSYGYRKCAEWFTKGFVSGAMEAWNFKRYLFSVDKRGLFVKRK